MTNEEIREQILTAAMTDLKEQACKVVTEIMSNLYSDYLPHVVSDTENNISFRVECCIKNMIAGKYEKAGGDLVWVGDGYGNKHLITLASYTDALKPLCELMATTITDNRIKQLEDEVGLLKAQLQDAYRR